MGHYGPVFIPIFMLLGYSRNVASSVPGGDSVTNVLALMSYRADHCLFQKYDKKAGFGTIVANMLPFHHFLLGGQFS